MKPQVYHSAVVGYFQGFATTQPSSSMILVTEHQLLIYFNSRDVFWRRGDGDDIYAMQNGTKLDFPCNRYSIYEDYPAVNLYSLRWAGDSIVPVNADWLIRRGQQTIDIKTSPLWLETTFVGGICEQLFVCGVGTGDNVNDLLDVYGPLECAEKVLTLP